MRFLCEFETKDLPVSYRIIFVSLIKDILKKEDEILHRKLFIYGDDKKNKATKSYTFAVLLKNPKIDGERIQFEGNVRWFFSSPDPKILINVYNGLKRLNTFSYREEKLDLKKITLLPQKVIGDETVVFKTLSPIHIKDKSGKPLSIRDENFSRELNYISDISLKNYRGYGIKKPLRFEPVNMKKVVVKERISGFDKGEFLYIEAWKGVFKLSGAVEDLRDLYELGVGFRRNQGFGMIEVI